MSQAAPRCESAGKITPAAHSFPEARRDFMSFPTREVDAIDMEVEELVESLRASEFEEKGAQP